MQFILMGFEHQAGTRLYAFQSTTNGVRADFTVGVELALIPRYGIRIQELPLLCRELLERQGEGEPKRRFTFAETEMSAYADVCAAARAAAAQRRKPIRRPPPSENAGGAWRAQAH
jgi:hypothetical protein